MTDEPEPTPSEQPEPTEPQGSEDEKPQSDSHQGTPQAAALEASTAFPLAGGVQMPPGLALPQGMMPGMMPGLAPMGPFQIGLPTGAVAAAVQVQLWQGQFPPPDAIEQYERVQQGTFDRIIKMAERAQEAQIEAQKEARANLRSDTKRGHYLGFVVSALAILGAVGAAYLGHPAVAVAIVGVPLMSVAKALVDSTKAKPTPIPVAALQAPPPAAQSAAPPKADSSEG